MRQKTNLERGAKPPSYRLLVDRNGGALVYVVVLMALLTVSLLTATAQWEYAQRRHFTDRSEYLAEYLAQAGQEDARARLSQDPNYDVTHPLPWTYTARTPDGADDLGTYTVELSRPSPTSADRIVASIGQPAGGTARERRVERTYETRGVLPTLFSNSSMSMQIADISGTIHSNGDINLVWSDTDPDTSITAHGQIRMEDGLIPGLLGTLLPGFVTGDTCDEGPGTLCDSFVPETSQPAPDESAIQSRATREVRLTNDNTSHRRFYLGGSTDLLFGINDDVSYGLDTSSADPLDLSEDPVVYIYKDAGDHTNYTVIIDDLWYKGRGTIAIGPGITVEFDSGLLGLLGAYTARIRRTEAGSCLALIIFDDNAISIPNVEFEGVLYARRMAMSSNFDVTGSLIAEQMDWPSSNISFQLNADPDILRNVPPEVPGATALVIKNES